MSRTCRRYAEIGKAPGVDTRGRMSAKAKAAGQESQSRNEGGENDESMDGNVSKPKFNIVADPKQERKKTKAKKPCRAWTGGEDRVFFGWILTQPASVRVSGLRLGWDPMGGTDAFVKCRRFLETLHLKFLRMRAGSKSFEGNCFAKRKLSKDGMIAVRPCPFHCIWSVLSCPS